MSFQINIPEMKKKTEIEDRLLFTINKDFQECINDSNYIKNNFTKIDGKFNNMINEINETNETNETNKANIENKVGLETKLLEYPNTIYSIFQCFYLKRKNYMGMNLTGLVQGRMETGLGFRSNIVKLNYNEIKEQRIKSYIIKNFGELTDNILIYKIKSGNFEWDKFGLSSCNFYYIVANLDIKKYFICT